MPPPSNHPDAAYRAKRLWRFSTPIDGAHLEQQIQKFSKALKTKPTKVLEYHLARCLRLRYDPGDLDSALQHVRHRSIGPKCQSRLVGGA